MDQRACSGCVDNVARPLGPGETNPKLPVFRSRSVADSRRVGYVFCGATAALLFRLAMQALFVAWYDFARKLDALKGLTPAMASGLTDHVGTIRELIEGASAC